MVSVPVVGSICTRVKLAPWNMDPAIIWFMPSIAACPVGAGPDRSHHPAVTKAPLITLGNRVAAGGQLPLAQYACLLDSHYLPPVNFVVNLFKGFPLVCRPPCASNACFAQARSAQFCGVSPVACKSFSTCGSMPSLGSWPPERMPGAALNIHCKCFSGSKPLCGCRAELSTAGP